MDYERGLVRLQEQLRKMNDEEAVRQIEDLAAQLRTLLKLHVSNADNPDLSRKLECIIDDLNRVAYRAAGTSFIGLCTDSRRSFSDAILSLSLGGILLLVLAILFLPGFGIALASSVIEITGQSQVKQIRKEIQAIDTRIGDGVTSFFYLSSISPCNDEILQKIVPTDSLHIETKDIPAGDPHTPYLCVWEYKDMESGKIIARDFWNKSFWDNRAHLRKREYYRSGTIIAQDSFDQQGDDCFRHRKYLDDKGQIFSNECYSEAGKLLSQETHGTWISPIPPMAYWFFYR